MHSDGQYRDAERLAVRRQAHGRPTAWPSMRSRPGSIIRARFTCCRTATCWWPKATRRRSRTTARASRALSTNRRKEWAGAGVPSANRITLLRDADGDGAAETRSVFLSGLNSPFGMVLVGNDFYVANSDAIMKFPYQEGDTKITAPGVKLADLPAGTLNHHWTKDLIASPDGSKLYATVGSNSNVAENGIEAETEPRRGARSRSRQRTMARIRIGPAQSERAVVAAAERRAVGRRQRARRTRQRSGARLHDLGEGRRASTAGPTAITARTSTTASSRSGPIWWRKAIAPDYALGAHTASLGLTFNTGNLFPAGDGQRRLHRPARLVESKAARRLQGDLRALRRTASPPASRRTC